MGPGMARIGLVGLYRVYIRIYDYKDRRIGAVTEVYSFL